MQRHMRIAKLTLLIAIVAAGVAACGGCSGTSSSAAGQSLTASAARSSRAPGFTSTVFVNAVTLTHQVGGATRPVIGPDDMTDLDGHLFVGFQNAVGSMGEASPLGRASTIVEFDRQGHKIAQWMSSETTTASAPTRPPTDSSPPSTRMGTRAST